MTLPAKARQECHIANIEPLAPLAILIPESVPRFLDSDLVFTDNRHLAHLWVLGDEERLDIALAFDCQGLALSMICAARLATKHGDDAYSAAFH